MRTRSVAPPPRPKLYATQGEALAAAAVQRCPNCGFYLHAAPDGGGWRLFCNNDPGHRV